MKSLLLLALRWVAAVTDPTEIGVEGAMRVMNLNRTIRYSRYATAAYCRGPLLENFECQSCTGVRARFIASFSSFAFDTSGYIAVDERDKRIVLAFKGTGGLRNQLGDITALLISFAESPTEGALVHSGFKFAMESMAVKFLPILKELYAQREYANYTLALAGHSLGGSIASLAAVKVHANLALPWTQMELYTYGQPRSANVVFNKWFSEQPIGSARVVYAADIVPHLMPISLGYYSHHHNEVWLTTNGTIVPCRKSVLEDRDCSYAVPFKSLSIRNHNLYFGIVMGKNSC